MWKKKHRNNFLYESVIMLILKILFLFVSIWFTLINTLRLTAKQNIHWSNLVIQAIGITGFITIMFLI